MSEHPQYLLGMEAAEIARLERQHAAWRRLTSKVWNRAHFGKGQVIIDLGCGPGFTSLDLADVVDERGFVVAVDSSAEATKHLREFIAEKSLKNLEVITADISNFDPSSWNHDCLFARWLFCFVNDPQEVMSRIASRLRPGTTVVVMDYWNYLAIRTEPSNALFTKVFRAVFDSFADAGGSLDVAGQMPVIFAEAGLTVTHVEPLCQVGRPRSLVWKWLTDFQQLYLPSLVPKGYLTTTELNAYQLWWQEQEASENAILFAPPVLGIIARKA